MNDLINDGESIDTSYAPSYTEIHKNILDILTRKKELKDQLAKDETIVKEEEIEQLIDEYPYSKIKNIKGFSLYVKKEFIFDCLTDIVDYAQKSWSKTSVIKILKKAYLERKIFSEEQQEKLGDMVSEASKKIVKTEKINMAKKYMDEKIKATPSENYYQVVDGRDEVYGVGDLDEWSTRQFGLNPLKR